MLDWENMFERYMDGVLEAEGVHFLWWAKWTEEERAAFKERWNFEVGPHWSEENDDD